MKTAAIILAAGQSRRMGSINKLVADVDGTPMVRIVGEAAAASRAERLYLVTGHERELVEAALSGLEITRIHNAEFEQGLSTSLTAGIAALDETIERAIILLGDMPLIEASMIDRMLDASDTTPGSIIIATCNGKRGNPVLWPREYFDDLMNVEGDIGARQIIARNLDRLGEVELGEAAARDVDTPEALAGMNKKTTPPGRS